ncbi:hypothetical protein MLD38_005544 [Melastoma candidum]|uniref:Uncharacterized protein n=1 Tax=Melastoma candidum TaxID=119954 RepID=A0ACB9RKI9_9MYRT|nr:hypothetical protein MLD38_005544 [Melastoma candidum]
MVLGGDLKVSATVATTRLSPHPIPQRRHNPSSFPFPSAKVLFSGFSSREIGIHEVKSRWSGIMLDSGVRCGHSRCSSGLTGDYQLSPKSPGQDVESFLLNTIDMNFFERLNLAWRIIFPSQIAQKNNNARIAKQRLKMILFSDRCAVSDEAKQKIVTNIVHALSDFVEIESQDKVQLTLATDEDLGTIYSVTVPVRRVKPAYQDSDEVGTITNVEYKDTGETSGTVDVRFNFFIPDENERFL